ncbi:unnamed protein product [Darwinula stevensoni]|uniref:Structural maintenance of chromosomes protein n=1 Tax=Darwinula stevensoni TaxID=69355 RepID=A0A7R8X195_9CRUS|nr:unnamed protein product [Darwinula stevensoni]CAG0882056.1 unnamed protein product [Darwinula stevensoni]
MHSVIIQGFKSYREQTVIEPFDPRHNVVVGRNGSGKSNFFQAIQFVLSDEFSYLRPEQRQALLHEGTGPRVISAFVEIIFDNTDQRLPIDKEEVFVRRVIGSKKDQYFLNKKCVTRSDIMNLLESAGFSRSNPYYIVKQGKINQMAIAPDSQRLKLLREVAGTRVYDERRQESMTILKETEGRREKIEEFLRTIEERLRTLEEEKEELKEYQKWDKMRRSLEYTIHDRELKETRKKLEEMEHSRQSSGKEQEKLRMALTKAQDNIKSWSKDLKDCKQKLNSVKEERDTLNAEHQQLLKDRTKLELQIKDLTDEVYGDNKSKERAEQELATLEKKIELQEKSLEELRPKYEEMKQKEEKCTRDLALKEQKRKELYAKQGRGSQFTSKEDRDKWIQQQLKSLRKAISDKREQIEKLTEDIERDADKKVKLQDQIQKSIDEYVKYLRWLQTYTNDMEQHRSSIDDHNKEYYEMKKKKDQLQSERNEFWRQENKLQQDVATLKEDLSRAEQSLRSMVGKAILNGRDSVHKVLETFREKGGHSANFANNYYGLVIENFECEKSIYTAVEVTAGNRLFHHVVESDEVATHILKEMNRQKLSGEVTFMPFNRLIRKEIRYPETKDAIPMVSKLQFDAKFDVAMKHIFGRTLICRNLEVATQLARSAQLDCITLDGDQVKLSCYIRDRPLLLLFTGGHGSRRFGLCVQVSCRGPITGGHFNTSRSRLDTQKNRSELVTQVKEAEEKLLRMRQDLTATETDINKLVSEMQKTETKNSKAKYVGIKLHSCGVLQVNAFIPVSFFRAIFDQMKGDIRLMREELSNIDRSKQPRERSLSQLKENLEAMETTKMGLESELHQVGRLDLDCCLYVIILFHLFFFLLQELLPQLSVADQREVDKLNDEIRTLTQENKEAFAARMKLEAEKNKIENLLMNNLNRRKEELVQALQEISVEDRRRHLENCQSELKSINKRDEDVTSQLKDTEKKVTDLSKKLFKQLDKANAELKKYSHVNKKALDQFVSFSDQKERLDLMNALEHRKYEAIQFTFKQVSRFFAEVFKTLVPSGNAQLVMRTDREDASEPEDEGEVGNADQFTGVRIKVSFSGRNAEMREMNQLSGGQKSLVALALIFAIQKCDPAPFYLFDEIDQALDAQHRKAVADMIHELSKDAQFITTTFRPELLEHANKFYGVKFRNKVWYAQSSVLAAH